MHHPPRVAVVVPCFGDGGLVLEAVRSVREPEAVQIVVVDDASPDPETASALDEVEERGLATVLRHPDNRGVARARMTGLAATSAPYVLPLDADDLAEPGVLSEMADLLDGDAGAAAVIGDIREFGAHHLIREVPASLDPFRVAYTNEYPITALFRRSVLDAVDGWASPVWPLRGYEDWNLWMDLAERGDRVLHLGPGRVGYRRRLHGPRLNASAKTRHGRLYGTMRAAHPDLFRDLGAHRRGSDLPWHRKLLYPVLYGATAWWPMEARVKALADRFGVWTAARPVGTADPADQRPD